MKKYTLHTILLILSFITIISCGTKMEISSNNNNNQSVEQTILKQNTYQDGIYAVIETSKGRMIAKLYKEESPLTVSNFVGLTEGTISNTFRSKGKPFYDGLIFHRVIKGFMIQTGDPKGTGTGGPGYNFKDEKNNLKHDRKGILSMANSGPNTNGSQFFITQETTPWLDGSYNIFGKIIFGEDVIDKIAETETDRRDKPLKDITIQKIKIIKKGGKYKNYNASKYFEENKK